MSNHLPMPYIVAGRCLLLLLTFAIAGCVPKVSTVSSSTPNNALWDQHKQQVNAINNWEIKAKVGLNIGETGGSATLRWQHSQAEQSIELSGPLGGGRVIIEETANGAVMTQANGARHIGNSAEALLKEQIGWHIPFDLLTMWIRGLPAPVDQFDIDENGLLMHTENNKWRVRFNQYQEINGTLLPRKLNIESQPGAIKFYDKNKELIADQLRIKVVILAWQLEQ